MNTASKVRRMVWMSAGILWLAATAHSFAQTARTITLEEAIEMSLKNSKQLKLSQSNIDLATLGVGQIKENQLPSLSVSGSYLRINTPNINLKTNQGASDSTGSSGGFPNVHQAMYGMASASLPLFSGFRFKYGIESAKYLEQAARLDADNDKDAVVQNAVAAYGNLYKAKKSVDLVTENLQREKERVQDFTNREKNGILARNKSRKGSVKKKMEK